MVLEGTIAMCTSWKETQGGREVKRKKNRGRGKFEILWVGKSGKHTVEGGIV